MGAVKGGEKAAAMGAMGGGGGATDQAIQQHLQCDRREVPLVADRLLGPPQVSEPPVGPPPKSCGMVPITMGIAPTRPFHLVQHRLSRHPDSRRRTHTLADRPRPPLGHLVDGIPPLGALLLVV